VTPSPSTTAAALGQIHGGADRARVQTSPAGPDLDPPGFPDAKCAGQRPVGIRYGATEGLVPAVASAGTGTGPQVADRAYQDKAQRHDAQFADRTFDVCLIMPLGEEFGYARDILRFEDPIDDGTYFLHPFSVPGSSVRGIAVVLFEMGLAAAAVAATRMLTVYQTRVLALVGIAGALSPDLRLGDVIVASSVDEYLHGAKAKPGPDADSVEYELGGASWQAAPQIVNFANNFRYLTGAGASFTAWQERARGRRDRSLAARIPALAGERPDYFVGSLATGDIVSAAQSFACWLRKHNRFRAAIEMEAGGAARAIYRHPAQLIVVRGISDLADERKDELDRTWTGGADPGAWRKYATHNAVDLLARFLADPQFPWPDRMPAGQSDHTAGASEPTANSTTISVGQINADTSFTGTTEIHGDLRIGR
jgi:nucleoside phosphorylase